MAYLCPRLGLPYLPLCQIHMCIAVLCFYTFCVEHWVGGLMSIFRFYADFYQMCVHCTLTYFMDWVTRIPLSDGANEA